MGACKFYSMTSMTARYGFHERFGLSLRFFFGFMSIHVAGKDAGQDRTRYLMDSRSDGCRNGDGRAKKTDTSEMARASFCMPTSNVTECCCFLPKPSLPVTK